MYWLSESIAVRQHRCQRWTQELLLPGSASRWESRLGTANASPPVTEEEAETQRHCVTCLQSHGWKVTKPAFARVSAEPSRAQGRAEQWKQSWRGCAGIKAGTQCVPAAVTKVQMGFSLSGDLALAAVCVWVRGRFLGV